MEHRGAFSERVMLDQQVFQYKSPALMALAGELTGYRTTTGKTPGCVIVSQIVWRAITADLCNSAFAHWPTARKINLVNNAGSIDLKLFRVPILMGYASDKVLKPSRHFYTLSDEEYAQVLATRPDALNS